MEKVNKICYTKQNRSVMLDMMMVANYLDDIIYDNQNLKEDSNRKMTLIDKLEIILIIKKSRKLWKTKKFKNHFERNKEVLNGKYVIKGTRITSETISNYVTKKIMQDLNREEIFETTLKDYPSITKEDIIACLVNEVRHVKYYRVLFDCR